MQHDSASTSDLPVLPKRWGLIQRSKNTLLYHLIRFLYGLTAKTPFTIAQRFGRLLGVMAYWLILPERRKAIQQLQTAFPENSLQQHQERTKEVFVHLGEAAAEITHLDALLPHPDLQLTPAHKALFNECLQEGKGVIAATGHLGNWELLAQVLAAHDLPIHTIAKPIYDPRLTHWVDTIRTRFGLKVIWRGRKAGSKALLRVFRAKEILALLIDQDTRVQSVFVPFFGKAASTPSAIGTLATRTGAPIVLGWLHRTPTGYRLHFERFRYTLSEDKDADIHQITAGITERLEWGIRQAPEQWVWMHQRWKTRPQENI